jgi:hypothetical protein
MSCPYWNGERCTKNKKTRKWLAPYLQLWEKITGGQIEPPFLARYISPLHTEHGEKLVLTALENYLKGTEAKYRSLPNFARNFGDWTKKKESLYGQMI